MLAEWLWRPVLQAIVWAIAMRDSTPRSSLIVFFGALVFFAGIAFSGPPHFSPDTTYYLGLASDLQTNPSEVVLNTKKATWTVLVLPALLAILQRIAPEWWPYVFVGVNAVALAFVTALLHRVVHVVTSSAVAALVAVAFQLLCYDFVSWVRFILTDMIYAVLAMAALAITLLGIVSDRRESRRRVRLAAVVAVAFITRASGAILVPMAVFSEWWAHGRPTGRFGARRLAPWVVLLVIGVAGITTRAWFYADISRWPVAFLRPILTEYAEREKTGEVVWGRTETFHEPPETTVDHVVIQLDRFIRFFQFTADGYSSRHNLINVFYYVPLYALTLLGLVDGLWGTNDLRRRIVAVTAAWIAATAWLHALTVLDFDWRYRLPVLPYLIVLAACGVEAIVRRAVRPAGKNAVALGGGR